MSLLVTSLTALTAPQAAGAYRLKPPRGTARAWLLRQGACPAAFSGAARGPEIALQDRSHNSDGTIVARTWDFGDGTTSSEPSHVYAAPGTYVVTDDSGRTGTSSQTVTVSAL